MYNIKRLVYCAAFTVLAANNLFLSDSAYADLLCQRQDTAAASVKGMRHSVVQVRTSSCPTGYKKIATLLTSADVKKLTANNQGTPGVKGEPGAKGDKGDTGPKGDAGAQGEKGDSGLTEEQVWAIVDQHLAVDVHYYIPYKVGPIKVTLPNGKYALAFGEARLRPDGIWETSTIIKVPAAGDTTKDLSNSPTACSTGWIQNLNNDFTNSTCSALLGTEPVLAWFAAPSAGQRYPIFRGIAGSQQVETAKACAQGVVDSVVGANFSETLTEGKKCPFVGHLGILPNYIYTYPTLHFQSREQIWSTVVGMVRYNPESGWETRIIAKQPDAKPEENLNADSGWVKQKQAGKPDSWAKGNSNQSFGWFIPPLTDASFPILRAQGYHFEKAWCSQNTFGSSNPADSYENAKCSFKLLE